MSPSEQEEVAATIESFLDGTCGRYEWDDLISIPRSDTTFEEVARYCASTADLYPTKQGWCNDEGESKLREFIVLLRSGASEDKIKSFVRDVYSLGLGKLDPSAHD